jgi:DNA-binding MarR family transcriptional regulator
MRSSPPGEEAVRAPRNPVYALFVANQRVRALLAIALRDAPIRSDEYGVYSAVFMARHLTPTQLARSTGMPLTTVADYIRAMAERGHLERNPNPADRRSVLLSLSPAGEETVRAIMPVFTRAVRMIYEELTVPNDELLAALDAIALATERATERILAEDQA